MSKLPEVQHHRLTQLSSWVSAQVWKRFIHGAQHHLGDIRKKACYPRLGPELFDAIHYYYEHRERMHLWVELLKKAERGLDGSSENEDVTAIVQLVREEMEYESASDETDAEVFSTTC